MGYFKKHRQNITKYFHMRGKEKTQAQENQKAEIHSSGVIREMKVQGSTYQDETETVPMNIQSMKGDGVGISLRGINLFDAREKREKSVNGTFISTYDNVFYINGKVESVSVNGIYYKVENLKPNTIYTARIKQVSGKQINGQPRFYYFSRFPVVFKENIVYFDSKKVTQKVGTISFTEKELSDGVNLGVFFSDLKEDAEYINYGIRADFVEGEYTEETFPDFENYIEPKTIKINTELHGIDGYNDILTLDFANNRVEAKRKVKVANLVDLIDENAEIVANGNDYAISICVPYIWQEGTKSYCTHCKSYEEISSNRELCFEFIKEGKTHLYFYWIEQSTVDDFRAWALENDVKIAFVTEDEVIENIDFKLMKDFLPHNATSVIEVDGSNGIDLTYYDLERN